MNCFLHRIVVVVAFLLVWGNGDVTAKPDLPDDDGQRGAYTVTFGKRSPGSQLAVLQKRFRFKPDPDRPTVEYRISDETYEVYVPHSYRPGVPYGLIVWINAVDYGTAFEQWRPVLEKRYLIWIGANNSGNQNNTYRRIALALDAVVNMTQRFTIDKDRVYGAGFSGGGRVASILVPTYPQVFRGGLYLCGANYFRDIPTGDGKFWFGKFPTPPKIARQRSRFVLLTGDHDFNLKNTKAVYEAYQQDRFQHATYLQVPGHDHEIPDGEWFEKGIAALDRPLVASAKKSLRQAAGLERNRQFGKAWLAYTRAVIRGADEEIATEAKSKADAIRRQYQEELHRIKQMIQNREYNKATAGLRKMKAQYHVLAVRDVDKLGVEIRELRKSRKH